MWQRHDSVRALACIGAFLFGGTPCAVHAESDPLADRALVAVKGDEEAPPVPGAPPIISAVAGVGSQRLVTARKRSEPAEEVPLSIDRLGGVDLRGLQIRRLDDASARVANLFVGNSRGLANSARSSLRGTGQNDPDAFIDPGVAVYLDGVYLARPQGQLLDLGDIELVEVIRGPQGTIFGKNALGGAINVMTRRPRFEFGGDAEVRFGNFDLLETRLALNVPLVAEKAAARVSLATRTRDGFVKNELNGSDFSDDKLLSGRLQLLLLPTANLELLLSAEQSLERRQPLGGKCVPAGKGQGLSAIPPAVTGFDAKCASGENQDEFKFASNVSFARDALRTRGGSLQAVWDVAPSVSITSISTVRQQFNERFLDVDSSSVNLVEPQLDSGEARQVQLSQELRVSGRAFGGKLGYLLGAYGFHERARQPDSDGLGFLAPFDTRFRTNNLSYEGFGQLTYSFTDRLELTLGLRRTQERKEVKRRDRVLDRPPAVQIPGDAALRAFASLPDASLVQLASAIGLPLPLLQQALQNPDTAALLTSPAFLAQITATLAPPFSFERSARFGEWSPSAALSYQLGNSVFYASYSTGFRSGGFNARAMRGKDTDEIKPEELTSYEIGVKSMQLDGRLQLRASAFYNIGRDVQLGLLGVDDFVGLTTSIRRNASRQLMRGGELSVAWQPLSGLRLGTELGVLDSKYVEFDDDLPDLSIEDEDPVISPNYTMSFSAEYAVALRPGIVGTRLNWTHTGGYNNDVQGTRALRSNKYGLLDGRLSLQLVDGKTEFAVFGTNLLNRRYVAGGVGFEESFGFATRFFGPPRFYGVELRRNF